MMASKAKEFERNLQVSDRLLRVRWRQPIECWCIERLVENTEFSSVDDLRRIYFAGAHRKLHDGLPPEALRSQLERRQEARARLDALNDPRGAARILIALPELDQASMDYARATLKHGDTWERGRHDKSRSAGEAATRITRSDEYEDDFREQQAKYRVARDMRSMAGEIWAHKGYREGSRTGYSPASV